MTDGVVLLRPLWLAALPILALLAVWGIRRAAHAGRWADVVDPHLYAALVKLRSVVPQATSRGAGAGILASSVAALAAVALSGPAHRVRDGAAYRNLDAVVLVTDLGPRATRSEALPAMVAATRQISEAAGSRPVALIVYAGDAYVASSFTTDAAALGTTIAVLDGETVPDRGDRPDRALTLARRMIGEAQVLSADVVLVAAERAADGPVAEAVRRLAADGHRVSTLAVAPDGTAFGGLAALARLGGGWSAPARDPAAVVDAVSDRRATRFAASGLTSLVWRDDGPWILALAVVPALLLFRRRA